MGLRYAAIPALLVVGVQLVPSAERPAGARPLTKKGATTASFERDVSPVLKQYCLSCHSGKDPVAGIGLDSLLSEDSLRKSRSMWERVSHNVSTGHMPPKSATPLPAAERSKLVTYVDTRLSTVDCSLKDPGRVTLRVADDGRGGEHVAGAGIRGMRERARLVGATLSIGAGPAGGTEVRLVVPVGAG